MSKDQNLLDYSKQEVILAFINKWIPDIRMDLDTYLALNEYIAHELLTEQEVILAFIKWLPDDEIGELIRANDWIFNQDNQEPDDLMDGDHDSAMTSAGFGTDEDYGYYGEND